ncbi:CoA transferase [Rhodohalobacter sp. SW132]|uniref:CaiB/BaiF CoA transferase family protein n=1 Tax=Rhodohalobacter sp. SW132 TaxID=2293433 RepID=UPI000E21D8E9|nr:CaiB/BaiF CoA-transferase family protein [Rhodohalobacter sp. SW132]REL38850.1 CoA transferase [Rhodohalobacter sp. SW132]
MNFQPLKDILVVSVEQAASAPLASCRLADAGARVIKIERDTGDFARQYDEAVKGLSTYFVWLNRGKESIRLDLKSDEGKDLFLRIVDKADVFIQNLAPGAMNRLKLNSERLRKRNETLITCDISGYGEEGEYSQMKAYDNLVQAESGLIDVTGSGDTRAKVGISIADISTGMHAYSAILEALIQRGKTGEGVSIKLSMFDSMADWMMVPWLHQEYGGAAPERTGVHHASISPYGSFKTRDEKEIMIGIQNEREWKRFCKEILNGAIAEDDDRFNRNSKRVKHRKLLNQIIQKTFIKQSLDELVEKLDEAKIAYSRLRTIHEFSKHPQLRLADLETENGTIRIADRPARFKGFESDFKPVPKLGEHDYKIKKEFT